MFSAHRVLTDRAFLAEPKTMLWAFMLGGLIAGAFIILFGLLGVFGAAQAITNPSRHAALLKMFVSWGSMHNLTCFLFGLGTSRCLALGQLSSSSSSSELSMPPVGGPCCTHHAPARCQRDRRAHVSACGGGQTPAWAMPCALRRAAVTLDGPVSPLIWQWGGCIRAPVLKVTRVLQLACRMMLTKTQAMHK